MTFDRRFVMSHAVIATTALIATSVTVAAQGGIRGIVKDNEGVGIAGATVTAESLESPATRTTTTNRVGRFAFIGFSRGDWLFVVTAEGFEPDQAASNVRRSGRPGVVEFSLEPDVFNPPAPAVGVLAGLKTGDLLTILEEAEALFDAEDYDDAIDAYRAILELAPALTSVNLQIGHAYREKRDQDRALAAYQQALSADPDNREILMAIDTVRGDQ